MEFSIEPRTVYHLRYKDQWGRWITHSTHTSPEAAERYIRTAKNQLRHSSDWGGYVEPGKAGPPRNPHGEIL